jgi:aminoglycoside phosphotransferase (APT) family kinase protein
VLPRFDDDTLISYLLSVAGSIHEQVNRGIEGDSATRLREGATIIARVAQQLSDRKHPSSWTAREEAVAIEAAHDSFAAAEAGRAAGGLGPAANSARNLNAAALERYLHEHPLGGSDTAILDARLLAGGRCKLTALITQRGAKHLPATFILRQDWRGGATDTSVTGEYALLERLTDRGIRAPRPLLLQGTPSAVGEPFIFLERMPGSLAGSLFTPPRSRALGLQLAFQMGQLHRLSGDEFRGLVPGNSLDTSELDREIERFREMHASIGIRSELIGAAIDWLAQHRGDVGSETCLTHNDLGFHNMLVEGDTLAAVLDWELAAIGHPAADLGYVRPFVPLMLSWAEFIAAYEEAGGRPVEPPCLRFHTVWNAIRLYGLIMQARSALARGLVNDIEIAFACGDNLMLLMNSLAVELREAGAI